MEDPVKEFICPACERRIVNRKLSVCLYCGATLPADTLFSPEQIAALDAQQAARREQSLRFDRSGRGGSGLLDDSPFDSGLFGGFGGDSGSDGGGNSGDGDGGGGD